MLTVTVTSSGLNHADSIQCHFSSDNQRDWADFCEYGQNSGALPVTESVVLGQVQNAIAAGLAKSAHFNSDLETAADPGLQTQWRL